MALQCVMIYHSVQTSWHKQHLIDRQDDGKEKISQIMNR